MFYDEEIKEFPDGNFSQPGDEVISIQIIDNQSNARGIGYHGNNEPLLSNMEMERNFSFENSYGRICPVLENISKFNWREGDSIFCAEPLTYFRRAESDYPKPEYSSHDEFTINRAAHVDSFTRNGKSFSQGDFSRIQEMHKHGSTSRTPIQEFASQDLPSRNLKPENYSDITGEEESYRDGELAKQNAFEKDKQYNNIHNNNINKVILKRSISDEEPLSTIVEEFELASYENDNILDIADRGYLMSESDTVKRASVEGAGGDTSQELDQVDAQTRYHFVKYIKRDGKTIKLWECGICGREFQHHYTLTRHLPTHTDERNFHCGACGKSFRQMSTLSQHRATHSLERPYACEICNKNFNRVSTLISHRKTHSGHKPYKCHICSKGFHQKGNLRNHMFTHTNERPYRCNFCDKGFNQQSNLVCHKNKAHGVIHDMRTARTAPRMRRAPPQLLDNSTPAPDSSGIPAHSSSASESASVCVLTPSPLLDAPWWMHHDLQPASATGTAAVSSAAPPSAAGADAAAFSRISEDIGTPVVINVLDMIATERKQISKSLVNVELNASRCRALPPSLHGRPYRNASAGDTTATCRRTLSVKATSSLLKSPVTNSAQSKFIEAPPHPPLVPRALPARPVMPSLAFQTWRPLPPPPRARTDPLLNHHQGGVGGLEAIVSLLASPVAGGFELGPNMIPNNQHAHAHAHTHAHTHAQSYTLDLFDHMDTEADGHHTMAPVEDEDADGPHNATIYIG